MITFIFNMVTLIFCVLAEYESKKMWNKFANVTPALHVIPVHIIVPWLSKMTSHFESLTQKCL